MTFEDIQRVNEGLNTTDIKGKKYVEVNQRIKAFRQLYPEGFIRTDLISNENSICVFKAEVGYTSVVKAEDDGYISSIDVVLATGTAYEKEQSSYINKTSYIENCETSAVGRALGMLGLGIDTSVASAEEVRNAINQQEARADEGKAKIKAQAQADLPLSKDEEEILVRLIQTAPGKDDYETRVAKICKSYGVTELADLKRSQYVQLVGKFK